MFLCMCEGENLEIDYQEPNKFVFCEIDSCNNIRKQSYFFNLILCTDYLICQNNEKTKYCLPGEFRISYMN